MAIAGLRRRRAALAAVLALVVLALVGLGLTLRAPDDVVEKDLRVRATPESGGVPVWLDASLFLPVEGSTPAPAVLLAHGFGGDKNSLTTSARQLAEAGYVVATYTARGFGSSGGLIHLDSLDFEVPDASDMIDMLATRPEVQTDGPGDPRVAVVGASYGGALALMVAGTDGRVDSIVPMITWNSLQQSLFPQTATDQPAVGTPAGFTPIPTPGVLKRLWAGSLFTAGSPLATSSDGAATPADSSCGRFSPELCAAYVAAARGAAVDPQLRASFWRSSPAAIVSRIRAPTLLIQGEADSLFPLSESDANAAGIASGGTPVKVVWVGGGHDGGFDESSERIERLVGDWLAQTLRDPRAGAPGTTFEAEVPRTVRTRGDRDRGTIIATAPGLPGLRAAGREVPPTPTTTVELQGSEQSITSPAGGTPAAITTVPGSGGLLSSLAGTGLDDAAALTPPRQSATFESEPLTAGWRVLGAPRARIWVRSSSGDATLFTSMQVVSPDGRAALPQRLVAPLHLVDIPSAGRTVDVVLPAIVRDVPPGARLRLVVTSTDAAYAMPIDPRTYTIGLASADLVVPLAPGPAEGGTTVTALSGLPVAMIAAAIAALAALFLSIVMGLRRRRTAARASQPDAAASPTDRSTPVVLSRISKVYGDGFLAVDDLGFTVETGQVLGLLGPNGAGKTTTLRMLLGLIRPTSGQIRVFGDVVEPGAPVLAKVGALVEGPGLLPHLSGLGNLYAYWRATGRPEGEARFDIALQIAGLGSDIERRVATYSHGMKQRLAIAQAMLGLPDLLVLDEPTNGLDPPQIAEMRKVLRSYADTGRTVIISSHLLAEVEATCTHVVVMSRGRLVAAGSVADVIGTGGTVAVAVDDPQRAAAIARALPGTADVRLTDHGLLLRLPGATRAELVRSLVEANIAVDGVTPQHGLEEAFLSLVGDRP